MNEGSALSYTRDTHLPESDISNDIVSRAKAIVLFLTTNRYDAKMLTSILNRSAIQNYKCKDVSDVCEQIERGAGALILAEEAMSPLLVSRIKETLYTQPSWSSLPIIIVTATDYGRDQLTQKNFYSSFAESNCSRTFLERPIRLSTFISVIRGALNLRRQQLVVRELIVRLEKAKNEAERANKAKSSFLTNMSHEIRTPLNAILGFGSLIADSPVNIETQREFKEAIIRNGKLLMHIVEDTLDLAKIESEKMTYESLPVSIPELLDEVRLVVEVSAHKKNIEFSLSLDRSPEFDFNGKIKTDPVRLKQILLNIIGNAIKFTEKGGVSVIVKSVLNNNDIPKIAFLIKDTGRGISPEQRKILFQPFVQADVSTTREFGGTGIGLVLSKRFANALGGDIEILSSELGVGSQFLITIAAPPFEGTLVESKSPPDCRTGELANFNILVVEDQPDNQLLMRYILQHLGATVEQAVNGEEGVKTALAKSFDAIFMDIQMPIKDGVQATRELREAGYLRPIIALSAGVSKEEIDLAINAGCNDYITKPFTINSLVDKLRPYLKVSKSSH